MHMLRICMYGIIPQCIDAYHRRLIELEFRPFSRGLHNKCLQNKPAASKARCAEDQAQVVQQPPALTRAHLLRVAVQAASGCSHFVAQPCQQGRRGLALTMSHRWDVAAASHATHALGDAAAAGDQARRIEMHKVSRQQAQAMGPARMQAPGPTNADLQPKARSRVWVVKRAPSQTRRCTCRHSYGNYTTKHRRRPQHTADASAWCA